MIVDPQETVDVPRVALKSRNAAMNAPTTESQTDVDLPIDFVAGITHFYIHYNRRIALLLTTAHIFLLLFSHR